MKPFDYLIAENFDAAVAEYGESKPALKAGGIDLIDLMKERISTPEVVLSIGGISDLSYITEEANQVRIGCLTTLADIGRNALLKDKYKALHHAAGNAATPQIRERATIGGNINQRPRCWYFRNQEFNCLKKGGATCFAVEGENQYHAVFGPGPCHIVHPSNAAPALVAMDATFVIASSTGQREVKAADFFVMPAESMYAENVLKPGEILKEIIVPLPQASATIELREKQSFDWPLAIASVAKVAGKWRVCLGAVAPKPWLSNEAMTVLGGNDITDDLAIQAGEAAITGAQPMSSNAYKLQLIRVAVKRALLSAAGREVPV